MFPSPYGDFVFQQGDENCQKAQHARRFRPLTGILFFNAISAELNGSAFTAFPSPYGDFVFQQHEGRDDMIDADDLFPSPYGDFVFQRKITW